MSACRIALAQARPGDRPFGEIAGTYRTAHRAPVRAGKWRYSVAFMAVNAEQAEDWNGASGREFIEQRERHERMLGPLTARLLAAAAIQDGEDVLDVGCG